MEQQKNVDVTVAMVAEVRSKFAAQSACSFDKGFYSPNNRKQLGEILAQVVLPKKGKLSNPALFRTTGSEHSSVPRIGKTIKHLVSERR
jgi:hypothetical protein